MMEIKTRIVYGCIFYTFGMALFSILRLLFDGGKSIEPAFCLVILGLITVLEIADGLTGQIPFKHKWSFYLCNFSVLYIVFTGYMLLTSSRGLDWRSFVSNTLFFTGGYFVINSCMHSIQLRNVKKINQKLL